LDDISGFKTVRHDRASFSWMAQVSTNAPDRQAGMAHEGGGFVWNGATANRKAVASNGLSRNN
jgi:hypothetical protein